MRSWGRNSEGKGREISWKSRKERAQRALLVILTPGLLHKAIPTLFCLAYLAGDFFIARSSHVTNSSQ